MSCKCATLNWQIMSRGPVISRCWLQWPLRHVIAVRISLNVVYLLILMIVVGSGGNCLRAGAASGEWLNWGGNLQNQRWAKHEHKITADSIQCCFGMKWRTFIGASVSATASISDGCLYFPDWAGNLFALEEETGEILWKRNLTQLTSSATAVLSRTTPAVAGELLIIGFRNPASILAVNRSNGNLVWSTQLDKHPDAEITMSGTAYNGSFYVGVSSSEEGVDPSLCCTFQGSFQKLDLSTGQILWKTPMLPDNGGVRGLYSGAAVWGSSPAIDIKRKLVYIATGNDYSVPPDVQKCENNQSSAVFPVVPDPCLIPENRAESVVAMDLDSGAVEWSTHLGGYDAYTTTCRLNPTNPNCPKKLGGDYDFGECPMLITVVYANGSCRDIAAIAQKSGAVWALDRSTGEIVWATVAGPGAHGGGAIWGAATDGETVYTNEANSLRLNFTLLPSSNVTNASAWVAVEASTGRILWSKEDPDHVAAVNGPVTVANGVLFVGAFDQKLEGKVYALNTKTGDVVWNATTEAPIHGGFSISKGCAFIGNGYFGSANTTGSYFYAFCVK